jgi:hypothetical protein
MDDWVRLMDLPEATSHQIRMPLADIDTNIELSRINPMDTIYSWFVRKGWWRIRPVSASQMRMVSSLKPHAKSESFSENAKQSMPEVCLTKSREDEVRLDPEPSMAIRETVPSSHPMTKVDLEAATKEHSITPSWVMVVHKEGIWDDVSHMHTSLAAMEASHVPRGPNLSSFGDWAWPSTCLLIRD